MHMRGQAERYFTVKLTHQETNSLYVRNQALASVLRLPRQCGDLQSVISTVAQPYSPL
jgi:hypothetical protein